MNPAIAAEIPTWFWVLFASGVLAILAITGQLLITVVRREMSRLDELPAAVTHLDKRVTVVEARLDVRRDILVALEERDRKTG